MRPHFVLVVRFLVSQQCLLYRCDHRLDLNHRLEYRLVGFASLADFRMEESLVPVRLGRWLPWNLWVVLAVCVGS